MDKHTFIQQYRDHYLFFAPGCLSLLGNHLHNTGSKQIGITIDHGVYLALMEKQQPQTSIHWINSEGESLSTDENTEQSVQLLHTLHHLIRQACESSENFKGMDLIFFSDLPQDDLFGGDDSNIMVLKFALQQLYQFKETAWLKPEGICQHWIAEAKSGHFTLCHQNNTAYIPWQTSEYRLVLTGSERLPESVMSVWDERTKELEAIHDQINQFFEISSLGDLTAEDQDWLDKVLTDENLKKRLRHVVNENTASEITAGLLSEKKIDLWGRILDHAHESMVQDFEIENKAAETLRNLARETGLVLGSTVISGGQHVAVLNLIKAEELDTFTEKLRQLYQETGQELMVLPLNNDQGECRRVTATGN